MVKLALLCCPLGQPRAEPPRRFPGCGPPSVEAAISAALKRQSTPDEAAARRSRLYWSALLPRLSAKLARSTGLSEYMDITPSRPDSMDLNNYLALRWEVRATWDLSRLVFDTRELQISAMGSRNKQERRKLTEQVVRLYFERCRLLLLDHLHASGQQPELSVASRIRLRRASALLNALTGGLFAPKEARQHE